MNPAVMTNYMQNLAMLAIVADAASLGGGVNLKAGLIAAPFTPSKALAYGDLVQPTFTGYAEKAGPAGSAHIIRKPDIDALGFAVQEPSTGLFWEATADPASEQVIYGWYLYHATGNHLLFTQLFDTPIAIAKTGDYVEVSAVMGFFDTDMLTSL